MGFVQQLNNYFFGNDAFALIKMKHAVEDKGYATGWTAWKEFEIAKGGNYIATCLRSVHDNAPSMDYKSPLTAEAEKVVNMAEQRGFRLTTGLPKAIPVSQ